MQSAIYLQLMAAAFSAQQAAGIQNTYLVQVRGQQQSHAVLCYSATTGLSCLQRAHGARATALPACLQVLGDEFDSSNWCSKHPDAATHALAAKQLIHFIDGVLPAFGNNTLVAD